ncbi:hypothetical protein WICMUC_002337 [Wickerhamomyces mucosus]|uniref:Dolichol-phosphate mannosyltransferase subunit 1 n=1 Tax=Wickerhamomyces mucosus TaxID=1378264 RepID=A0A9P8TF37_9ASCO|nr:hypothetical protein WICMUC_002337 [Wickerhamomyces mucosus]
MAIENSIIVPAYHEKLNIRPLTTRVFAALGNEDSKKTEIIFVDDNSKDGSVEEVQTLQKEGYNVSIIVRTAERGLSSAVLRGFVESNGEYLVCMDADLQHPPESIPDFLKTLRNHPFVIGTRYAAGVGIDKDWPLYRRVISGGARLLALPLTSVSDPMSGYFGLHKKYLINAKQVDAQGFKIALELLAKLPLPKDQTVGEFPYSFGVRTEGESKLSSKVMIQYLAQLKDLYVYKFTWSTIIGFFLIFSILIMTFILELLKGYHASKN